jgi:putative tryptophan/tyrosine transport system substrate-binding protein
MRRRDFITALGGTAAFTWPLTARSQQKLRTVGILVLGTPIPEPFLNRLRDGLQKLGYTEGQNIRLEIRSAEGNADLLPEKAAELVRLRVDVIAAYQTQAATAAKRATGEIPIVMASVGDPVGTGLVASYDRPGANVTGVTAGITEMVGKLVELIREVLPSARRFAVLANETDPFTEPFLAAIRTNAGNSGVEMLPIMARPVGPLEAAFETMTTKGVNAVIIQGSMVRREAVELATKFRLPLFGISPQVPALGGLMSYVASVDEMDRDAAGYIDKLLRGAKPSDLPVSFPTKFYLVINLTTAKALDLTLPPTLIARADEVIE